MTVIKMTDIDLSGKPHRENYPFGILSEKIKAQGFCNGLIIAENMFIGGNMRLFFPDSRIVTTNITFPENRSHDSVLLLWENRKPDLQLDWLADCDRIYHEKVSAASVKRSSSES